MPNTVTVICPYCEAPGSYPAPHDYAPRYLACAACGERFIAEPTATGIDTFRQGEAPCCSDPDCRSTEMSMGDD